ncbi:MAG: NRDE family protein [Bacteroidota bacterium]
MCTVSYLPKASGGFILTSNRDEAPSRATSEIKHLERMRGQQLIFPQDPHSGGSWICLSNQKRLVCLLNGAFKKHDHRPPYRRSRGLVVLDVFDHPLIDDFFTHYLLDDIEPFTMVVVDQNQLFEFRWDGQYRHLQVLDSRSPYIWSSSTLYTPHFRQKRAELFEQWLALREPYEVDNILQFHQSGGTGDADNDFVMNRNNIVRTISITSVERDAQYYHFLHKDLLKGQSIQKKFEIQPTASLAKN